MAYRPGQISHRSQGRDHASSRDGNLGLRLASPTLAAGRRVGYERPPYWLHPFENYKTFCPYLVGTYENVASSIAEYLDLGFTTFIVDVPLEQEDLTHVGIVFDRAQELAPA